MEDNYLIHHGVKGMKWGVRRKDPTAAGGSSKKKKKISPAEEAKSMSNEELRAKNKRLDLERRYYNATKPNIKSRSQEIDSVGKIVDGGSNVGKTVNKVSGGNAGSTLNTIGDGINLVKGTAKLIDSGRVSSKEKKHAKEVNKRLQNMSDDDLAKIVDRVELENRYVNLKSESTKRGKKDVTEKLAMAGNIAVVASSAVSIASAIYMAVMIAKKKKNPNNLSKSSLRSPIGIKG